MWPVERLASSLASFTRWASPPDRVGAGWPRRTYPRPTSTIVCMWRAMTGWLAKNSSASSHGRSSTSAMFLPLNVMSSVSRL